jgi:glycerol-3-phosphate acyltransferase PlsY
MRIVFFAIIAYLYGAIPYAYVATRLSGKKSLAEEGTGNIGVTNAFKVGGTAVGIITVAGEISKALVPILTATYFFEGSLQVTLLFVYLSFFGTSFSIFLKGKGGKGSTVAIWSLLILSPYACVTLLAVWAGIVLIAKNNPWVKTIPLMLLPVIFHMFEKNAAFTAFCVLLSLTIFINNRIRLDDYKYYNLFKNNPLREHDAERKS